MKLISKVLIPFIVFALMASQAIADPIVIRFSHVVPEDTPKGQMANRFKSLVKERLGDDKVIVKVFPKKELFNDNEAIDALVRGDLELAAPATSKLEKITKRLQVLDIPFLFQSPKAVENFLKGTYGQRILGLFERKGIKGLGYFNNGMKQLSSNQPMNIPDDVKGLKFRIMNSEVIEDQFETLGAVPLKLPFSQINQLIEAKTIDGQENTWSNIYTQKFHENQKFIVETNHAYLGYALISGVKFWESLPNDVRPVIETALKDAIAFGNQVAKEKASVDKENILKAKTSNVVEMGYEQRKLWADAFKPLWKEYEAKIGTQLMNAARDSS